MSYSTGFNVGMKSRLAGVAPLLRQKKKVNKIAATVTRVDAGKKTTLRSFFFALQRKKRHIRYAAAQSGREFFPTGLYRFFVFLFQ